jgi:hypothetical protein
MSNREIQNGTRYQYAEQSLQWEASGRTEDQYLQRVWNLANDVRILYRDLSAAEDALAVAVRERDTLRAQAEALHTRISGVERERDEKGTIQSLFDSLEEWGAATAQIVPRDGAGVALRAVIVVDGQPETDEILKAVDAVEATWDETS